MKKIILLASFTVLTFFANTQKNVNTVSFDGIDELVPGLGKEQLEKLLGTKIVLKHIGKGVQLTETIEAMYKGYPVEIDLMGSTEKNFSLEGVRTTSPMFKTPEGIGVGSDQQTIINTYEKKLLIIGSGYITLVDLPNIHASIVFRMENKKVVALGPEPTAEFRDVE